MFGKKGTNQYNNMPLYGKRKWEDVKNKRKWLLENNDSCEECGFNTKRECGSSILEVHHIDNDSNNNSRDNLRLLCPNCHALTENFRNWNNRGNKKISKRIRKGNINFCR